MGRKGSSRSRRVRVLARGAAVCLTLVLAGAAGAAPGDLDPAFGVGGRVITDLGGATDQAHAVVVQPDGKIVAAGFSSGPASRGALVRYNPDGTLDPSFGTGGIVLAVPPDPSYAPTVITALALQPDGKIVAVAPTERNNIFITRFNPDGTVDSSFRDGYGWNALSASDQDYPFAVALRSDGAIVVGGMIGSATGQDAAVFVLTADGHLDPTFGFRVIDRDVIDQAHAVAVQPDGKIVAAGVTCDGLHPCDFLLARLNTDGRTDTGFGTDGIVTTDFPLDPNGPSGDIAEALLVQPDGKIVAAGTSGPQGAHPLGSSFALARYNPDGSLDASFGSLGRVRTDFDGPAYSDDHAYAVLGRPDGTLVAAGTARTYLTGPQGSGDFALARYSPTGAPDASFGGDGTVTTDFGADDVGLGAAAQPDGKLVAAGYRSTAFTTGEGTTFALARYDGSTRSDSVPPTITCRAKPDSLWPANHKLLKVTTVVRVKDEDSRPAGFVLISVTSNEADSGLLPYDVPDDIQGWELGTPDTVGFLRAEHAARRTYTLTYEGYDAAGNAVRCVLDVEVRR
jgi:uncharacterized delta-60 repeat protein